MTEKQIDLFGEPTAAPQPMPVEKITPPLTGASLEEQEKLHIDTRPKDTEKQKMERVKQYLSSTTREIKLRTTSQKENPQAEIAGGTGETADEKTIEFFYPLTTAEDDGPNLICFENYQIYYCPHVNGNVTGTKLASGVTIERFVQAWYDEPEPREIYKKRFGKEILNEEDVLEYLLSQSPVLKEFKNEMKVEKRQTEDGDTAQYYDILMRGTKIRMVIIENGKVTGEGGLDEYDIAQLKKPGTKE